MRSLILEAYQQLQVGATGCRCESVAATTSCDEMTTPPSTTLGKPSWSSMKRATKTTLGTVGICRGNHDAARGISRHVAPPPYPKIHRRNVHSRRPSHDDQIAIPRVARPGHGMAEWSGAVTFGVGCSAGTAPKNIREKFRTHRKFGVHQHPYGNVGWKRLLSRIAQPWCVCRSLPLAVLIVVYWVLIFREFAIALPI